jgi:hypothetical protein
MWPDILHEGWKRRVSGTEPNRVSGKAHTVTADPFTLRCRDDMDNK